MIKILNQAAIVSNFSRVTNSTVDSVRDALEVVGQEGVTITRRNTPVISGRLKGSMSYTIDGKVKGNENDDGIKPSSDKDTVVIGTNVVYAPSVEFMSNTGSKAFMERSFNQLKQVVKKIMAQEIKKGVG